MKTIHELRSELPQAGRVEWIGIRPGRREELRSIESCQIFTDRGIEGDHTAGKTNPKGRRHVTLIQWEHLPVVASLTGRAALDPALLRRNIAVSGVNLLALKDRRFRIGEAVLEGTGLCDPCSRMNEILGPGGYNAMRGHGGITARVVESGEVRIGDVVMGDDSWTGGGAFRSSEA